MCDLGSAKFDTMEVNTDLAKKYFQENSNTFKSITEHYSILIQGQKESDGYNTIIFSTFRDGDIPKDVIERTRNLISEEKFAIICKKLLELANLIEENAELFAQIEHLVRNKSVKEVKEFDIQLITQNLLYIGYISPSLITFETDKHTDIKMTADTPLAHIAFVAQLLLNHEKVRIFPTKETAAVSCLFVELCGKVGLHSIEVIFLKQIELVGTNLHLVDMANIPTITKGCVGVITERSDLDSAVDVFLRTTTSYPWKLNRIFVQESTYDRFKKTMSWKTGLASNSIDPLKSSNRLSDNFYEYDGKTFLVDYAGSCESVGSNKILVEAYRTTKELIAMVTKYKALFISLWSSDISEANEIAYKVPSSIVWINNYGVFDGPPQCSQAIYKELLIQTVYKLKVVKGLMLKQMSWSTKTFEERRRFALNAAIKYLRNKTAQNEAEVYSEDIAKLITALGKLKLEHFVVVEDKRMCTLMSVPNNNIFFMPIEAKDADFLAKLLTSGVAVALLLQDNGEGEHFVHKLDPEIPVSLIDVPGNNELVSTETPRFHTKVVWTNFGTTFAN